MKSFPINASAPSSRASAARSRDDDRELASSFLSSLLEMSAWQQKRREEIRAQQKPATPAKEITSPPPRPQPREAVLGHVLDRFEWFGAQLNDALQKGRRPPPPAPKTEAQLNTLEQIQTTMEIGLIRRLSHAPPPPPIDDRPAQYRDRAVRLYQEHALMI